MVLDGEAAITEEGGDSVTLRGGDFAHFPTGLKTSWKVDKYVKKTFTIRTPDPLEL